MSKYNPEYKKMYYLKNKERIGLYKRAYANKNKEKLRSYSRDYIRNNRERMREKSLESYARCKESKHRYYLANRDKIRTYKSEWSKKNMARVLLHCSDRHAIKLMARPPWVSREDLMPFYIEAKRKTLITGIPHDVDHIWPLQGKGFIGLQVPWNLQVITRIENIRKHNKRPDLCL